MPGLISLLIVIVMTLALLLYCWTSIKSALHAFQQNHYEPKRYSKWLKDRKIDYEDIIIFTVKSLPFFVLFYFGDYVMAIILAAVLGFVYLCFEKKKNYIQPLVYTSRIKRQIAVIFVLYAVIVNILTWLVFGGHYFYSLLVAFSPILSWILIYPMFYILEPVENSIRNRYINEAKDIINSDGSLVKVGITGSYGKTSTKNIVQSVISEKYYSLMTPASYNTPLGITRTIRENLKATHEVFICEMGADKVDDISYLMDFVKPRYGIVTSIGPQHLNTFGSLDNIIKEKMMMIEKLPSDGVGILNYDNEYIRYYEIKNDCRIIKCGIDSDDADYQAVDIRYNKRGSSFKIKHDGRTYEFETKLLGKHNVMNILIAVALAQQLGLSMEELSLGVKNIEKIEHRLELKTINGLTFIDDAFNSNPVGSANALEVLSMMDKDRWIVTPGMIDLGKIQDEVNYNFGTLMKGRADKVVLVGRNQTRAIMEGLDKTDFNKDNIFVVDKVKEAFTLVYQNASSSDTILLENDLPDAFNS